MQPKSRYKYRLISELQAEQIRALYRFYTMYELHRYLPLSYPTIRNVIRRWGAYSYIDPEVPDYCRLTEALEITFAQDLMAIDNEKVDASAY